MAIAAVLTTMAAGPAAARGTEAVGAAPPSATYGIRLETAEVTLAAIPAPTPPPTAGAATPESTPCITLRLTLLGAEIPASASARIDAGGETIWPNKPDSVLLDAIADSWLSQVW